MTRNSRATALGFHNATYGRDERIVAVFSGGHHSSGSGRDEVTISAVQTEEGSWSAMYWREKPRR